MRNNIPVLAIVSLILITLLDGASVSIALAEPVIVADSGNDPLLTADQVVNFIAVKQALWSYWQAPEHTSLRETAKRTMHKQIFRVGEDERTISIYDYPDLARQDTALTAVFAMYHLAPEQFEPIHVAMLHALVALVMMEKKGIPLPASSTVLGRNVVLVRSRRAELAAVKVKFDYVYAESDIALTADQVTHYIAVKRALRSYWQAPEHAAFLQIARATELHPAFEAIGTDFDKVGRVNNYPNLVKQDTALASIFTTNHLASEQFERTQIAVYQAYMALTFENMIPINHSPIFDRNLAIVRARREELAAVGVRFKVPGDARDQMDP